MLNQRAVDGSSNAIGGEILTMIVLSLACLCIIIWYVSLLWNAFKVATGITYKYRVIIFIVSIIIADTLSRLCTMFINN